ncbi:MAG: hypothetical protein M1834_006403 [Cirrosporium novae-zelandiae]|nr:MAG: hypothetical protein M1834_006403 [Cirrosporium novae-zelandiae]
MPPKGEKSSLKRGRPSVGEDAQDIKKPRRSERISAQSQKMDTPIKNKYLPSPITNQESSASDLYKEGTITPPEGRPSQIHHRSPISSPLAQGLSSPPSDTQPFSQFLPPSHSLSYEVEDEEAEGVWGYLVAMDSKFGDTLVLKKRYGCPDLKPPLEAHNTRKGKNGTKVKNPSKAEEIYENENMQKNGVPAGGYLIGRHRECDRVLNIPTISNRHCLIFSENKGGDYRAVLEDLSSNGTFVNEAIVGRNNRRVLEDGDEITILDEARFVFRYPKNRESNAFRQQYRILNQLGKGHFATVYLCVDRETGHRYAVKRFEKRPGENDRLKTEGLQQEIAILMGVSHPNVLCLKDTFDDADGVYLVLELAPEGELFNWIVMKQKLTENETRRVFIQLFQGIKYLHERNIVHRDIKPENILLIDKSLTVKLADFGLAKIIGEESFTTTLCGTPSYVAPEILEKTSNRRYTRAVDVWSLGVVLYICLCGFPPFSDELCTRENPYTLSQQIKLGRFDYPSPYWDSVGDPALDLIDRMLTVDVDRRITIDECLEHPWVTQRFPGVADSTDGLTGALQGLDFSKRKVERERTLLSSINDVKVDKVIEGGPKGENQDMHIKVWEKNKDGKRVFNPSVHNGNANTAQTNDIGDTIKASGPKHEETPGVGRAPEEFMGMGGKGDQQLFGDDNSSRYIPAEKP